MRKSFYFIISIIIIELLYSGCKSTNPQVDENKYNEFISYCSKHLRNEPNEITQKIDSVISDENTDIPCLADLLMIKAKCKFVTADYDYTNLLLDTLLYYANNEKNPEKRNRLLSDIYNTRGNIYSRKTLSDSAIACFEKAYYYSSLLDLSIDKVNISINLADAFVRKGEFDMGAYWYRKSLSISDTLHIPENQRFPSFYGLGHVYMELRDFSLCDFYYNMAGKYYNDMEPFEKHFYLNNRGNSYYFRGDYKTALEYFRTSYALVNTRKEMEFERNLTMVNLGEIFILLNETDSATYYLKKCYNFFQSIKSISALYYIETQLIELALKKGNVSEAKKIIDKAVKPPYVEPNMKLIRNKYLQHYYEKSGDFKNAYFYQNENLKLDDSIRNTKIKMRTSEIGLRYRQDSTLMKKELAIIEKENKLTVLNLWIYLLAIGIMLIIALSITYVIHKKRKNDKKIWALKTDINSMRLESIRNRISPHFIFNVLNREIVKQSENSDKDNLIGLSKLIRKNLELTDSHSITLKNEIEFVNTYISIEKQNLGNEFKYDLQIDKKIDINSVHIPSMFIQIPVENAIKHSLQMKKGKKTLHIQVDDKTDGIEIKITDNGGGFKSSSINRGTQTGLKVITQSIQLLNLNNKRAMTLKISNVNLEDSTIGCEIKYFIPQNFNYNIKR